ncbi:MAG TPA: hypothetical protein VF474_04265 [Phenylobacterium sp.]
MTTLTEMVAAVVVHSSAVAFSHFGVTMDAPKAEPHRPAAAAADQRIVARSPRPPRKAERVLRANCPDMPSAGVAKA